MPSAFLTSAEGGKRREETNRRFMARFFALYGLLLVWVALLLVMQLQTSVTKHDRRCRGEQVCDRLEAIIPSPSILHRTHVGGLSSTDPDPQVSSVSHSRCSAKRVARTHSVRDRSVKVGFQRSYVPLSTGHSNESQTSL